MAERNVPNYQALIDRFGASHQWDRMLETARKWLSVEPESTNANFAAGYALVYLKRSAEAERHIVRVLAKTPDHGISHCLMSDIHFNAGRFKAADESIRKAISLEPARALYWYHLALMCYRQGDSASAKKFGSKALELSPRNALVMNFVTVCEPATSSNASQLLAQYHAALEMEPENATIHNSLGLHHLDVTQDDQAAEECFRRALFFDPSDKTARVNLFGILKYKDPIYRALQTPKAFLLEAFSLDRKVRKRNSFFYFLALLLCIFAFRFVLSGLILGCLVNWSLVKVYEHLTIGDILSKAGEPCAKRGGVLGYRRWPLRIRLGLFAGFLALSCSGAALLWTRKGLLLASEGSQLVFGICIVFGITALTLMMILWMAQKNWIKSAARDRAKKFATLLDPDLPKKPWWQFWQRQADLK